MLVRVPTTRLGLQLARERTYHIATHDESGREVLESGFRVLRALPDADERRQVSSLAELTTIPRSTVYRLLRQLRGSGAVELRPDGRWVVSPHLLEIAGRVQPLDGIRTGASRIIAALRANTGATISLVVPTETSLVAVEMIPGREGLPFDAYPGAEMPGTSAAAAVLDAGRARDSRRRPFDAAVDDQHSFEGVTCYARLVRLPGAQRAALLIATSASRRAENFAAHVQRAGNAIEILAAGRVH
jgi:IclR family transcriptional regulator, acetate operon repressor